MIVLIFVVYLVIGLVVADEYSNIAQMKGHDGGKYFWYCVLFNIVGFLMVVALPDRNAPVQQILVNNGIAEEETKIAKEKTEVNTFEDLPNL